MSDILLERVEGPRVYRPTIGTTRTLQEFGKAGEEKSRAVPVAVRHTHTTATLTVYPDRASVNGISIGPGESWWDYFERGLKALPMVSDTVGTVAQIVTREADFGSETA